MKNIKISGERGLTMDGVLRKLLEIEKADNQKAESPGGNSVQERNITGFYRRVEKGTENKKEKKRKTSSSRNFTERSVSLKWNWTGLKKNLDLSVKEKVLLIEHQSKMISIKRQAELLGIARSRVYYKLRTDLYSLELMHVIEKQYTKTPFYGPRRIREILKRKGYLVNRKRIQRLMRLMGIEAIYPKRNLSKPSPGCKIYPYLFRQRKITRVNEAWATDITYIRMRNG